MNSLLKQIRDFPQLYLINYYDNMKANVDTLYEIKMRSFDYLTEDNCLDDHDCTLVHPKLKEEKRKEWFKLIDIINICLAKCIKNTIPNKLIKQANALLDNNEPIKDSDSRLEIIKNELTSHLFATDSHLAIFTAATKFEQILFLEEPLSSLEIEYFQTMCFHWDIRINRTEKFDLLEMNTIFDNGNKLRKLIVHFESLLKVNRLELSLKNALESVVGGFELKVTHLRKFTNLTYLKIRFAHIKNLECLHRLNNLQEVYICCSNVEYFNSYWLKELSNLASIRFMSCKLGRLDLSYLWNLKVLSLEACDLTKLKKDNFVHLVYLEELVLSRNKGLRLQSGCFNGLAKLRKLDLSDCLITVLKENIFFGLENLSVLDLSRNQRIHLKKGCFRDLKSLEKLQLIDCAIEELNPSIMIGLENLKMLYASSNIRVRLKEDLFKRLSKLKYLCFSYCHFEYENNDVFKGLDELEELYLMYNNIISFDESFLEKFSKLNTLCLSSCKIPALKKDFFLHLDKLERLLVDSNKNIVLEDGCFNGLNRLKELKLACCNITVVKENLFFGLDSLESVDLRQNDNMLLEDGCFNCLKNLKEIKQ